MYEEKKIKEIKSLKIQGAKSVALNAISILEHYYKVKGFNKEFFSMAEYLQNIRSTQAITYNVIEYIKNKKDASAFNRIKKYLERSYEKLAEEYGEVLEGNEVIMTHCHSSEEMHFLKKAKDIGYNFTVYVTETRPKYQGIITAKELNSYGIKVKYIVDNASAFYMDRVDVLLFGSDAIRKEGIVNKIGTYLMAIAGKEKDKEVWFIGDIAKLDKRERIEIEMRPRKEITANHHLPKSIEVLNPAFDITPWKYVTGLITDIGIFYSWKEMEKIDLNKIFDNYK